MSYITVLFNNSHICRKCSHFANISRHYVVIDESLRSDSKLENFRKNRKLYALSATCEARRAKPRNTNSTAVGANGCRNAAI